MSDFSHHEQETVRTTSKTHAEVGHYDEYSGGSYGLAVSPGQGFSALLLNNLMNQLSVQLGYMPTNQTNGNCELLDKVERGLARVRMRLSGDTPLTAEMISRDFDDIDRSLGALPRSSWLDSVHSTVKTIADWLPVMLVIEKTDPQKPEYALQQLIALNRKPMIVNELIEAGESVYKQLNAYKATSQLAIDVSDKVENFLVSWKTGSLTQNLLQFLQLINDDSLHSLIHPWLPAPFRDALKITGFLSSELTVYTQEASILSGAFHLLRHIGTEGFRTRLGEQEIGGKKIKPLAKAFLNDRVDKQSESATLKVVVNLCDDHQSWWDFFSSCSSELLQIPAIMSMGSAVASVMSPGGVALYRGLRTLLGDSPQLLLMIKNNPNAILGLIKKDIQRAIEGSPEDSGLVQLLALLMGVKTNALLGLKPTLEKIYKFGLNSWKDCVVSLVNAAVAIANIVIADETIKIILNWFDWLFEGLVPIIGLWLAFHSNDEIKLKQVCEELHAKNLAEHPNGLLSNMTLLLPWMPVFLVMKKSGVGLPAPEEGGIKQWIEKVATQLLVNDSLVHIRGDAETLAGEWLNQTIIKNFTFAMNNTLVHQAGYMDISLLTKSIAFIIRTTLLASGFAGEYIKAGIAELPGIFEVPYTKKMPRVFNQNIFQMNFGEYVSPDARFEFPRWQDTWQDDAIDWEWWTKVFGLSSLLLFTGAGVSAGIAYIPGNKEDISDEENPLAPPSEQHNDDKREASEKDKLQGSEEEKKEKTSLVPSSLLNAKNWMWGLGILSAITGLAAIGSGIMWYNATPRAQDISAEEEMAFSIDLAELLFMAFGEDNTQYSQDSIKLAMDIILEAETETETETEQDNRIKKRSVDLNKILDDAFAQLRELQRANPQTTTTTTAATPIENIQNIDAATLSQSTARNYSGLAQWFAAQSDDDKADWLSKVSINSTIRNNLEIALALRYGVFIGNKNITGRKSYEWLSSWKWKMDKLSSANKKVVGILRDERNGAKIETENTRGLNNNLDFPRDKVFLFTLTDSNNQKLFSKAYVPNNHHRYEWHYEICNRINDDMKKLPTSSRVRAVGIKDYLTNSPKLMLEPLKDSMRNVFVADADSHVVDAYWFFETKLSAEKEYYNPVLLDKNGQPYLKEFTELMWRVYVELLATENGSPENFTMTDYYNKAMDIVQSSYNELHVIEQTLTERSDDWERVQHEQEVYVGFMGTLQDITYKPVERFIDYDIEYNEDSEQQDFYHRRLDEIFTSISDENNQAVNLNKDSLFIVRYDKVNHPKQFLLFRLIDIVNGRHLDDGFDNVSVEWSERIKNFTLSSQDEGENKSGDNNDQSENKLLDIILSLQSEWQSLAILEEINKTNQQKEDVITLLSDYFPEKTDIYAYTDKLINDHVKNNEASDVRKDINYSTRVNATANYNVFYRDIIIRRPLKVGGYKEEVTTTLGELAWGKKHRMEERRADFDRNRVDWSDPNDDFAKNNTFLAFTHFSFENLTLNESEDHRLSPEGSAADYLNNIDIINGYSSYVDALFSESDKRSQLRNVIRLRLEKFASGLQWAPMDIGMVEMPNWKKAALVKDYDLNGVVINKSGGTYKVYSVLDDVGWTFENYLDINRAYGDNINHFKDVIDRRRSVETRHIQKNSIVASIAPVYDDDIAETLLKNIYRDFHKEADRVTRSDSEAFWLHMLDVLNAFSDVISLLTMPLHGGLGFIVGVTAKSLTSIIKAAIADEPEKQQEYITGAFIDAAYQVGGYGIIKAILGGFSSNVFRSQFNKIAQQAKNRFNQSIRTGGISGFTRRTDGLTINGKTAPYQEWYRARMPLDVGYPSKSIPSTLGKKAYGKPLSGAQPREDLTKGVWPGEVGPQRPLIFLPARPVPESALPKPRPRLRPKSATSDSGIGSGGSNRTQSGNQSPASNSQPSGKQSPASNSQPSGNQSPASNSQPSGNQSPASNSQPSGSLSSNSQPGRSDNMPAQPYDPKVIHPSPSDPSISSHGSVSDVGKPIVNNNGGIKILNKK